ncbi:MAG: coenzyme F420-0:L-glutamate ligase [Acidobacteriota bacterium]|nr:coenzyme F420-0:L-glutamate ligase [Acidobacteriota bacterium]
MSLKRLQVIGLSGLPEVAAGDDLPNLITTAIRQDDLRVNNKDIFVIAQKIVSKAEGRVVNLAGINPSSLAQNWARAHGQDPRVIETILRESRRLVRMERGVIIAETRQGYVCANAGVDTSNVPEGMVTLLPENPDHSAVKIQADLEKQLGVKLAVIVSDTFGRPWRDGLANVALGVSGMKPFVNYRNQRDHFGNKLEATRIAVADELASAAELTMGKMDKVPVALIQGFSYPEGDGHGLDIVRAPRNDLFR